MDSGTAAQMSTSIGPSYQNGQQPTASSPDPASALHLYSVPHRTDNDTGGLPFSTGSDEPQRAQHTQQEDPVACGPSSGEAFSIDCEPDSVQHAGVSNATHHSNRDDPSPVESNSSQQTSTPSRDTPSTTGALPHLNILSPRAFADEASIDQTLTPQPGAAAFECRYPCLYPLLPFFSDTFPASLACDLFDVYLVDPGTSLFRCASPYIMTRIFRKKSLLHPTNPRPTSSALLATILWCCAQTADLSMLLVPGSRSKLTDFLYELAVSLINCRDPDRWRRVHGRCLTFFLFLQHQPGLADIDRWMESRERTSTSLRSE